VHNNPTPAGWQPVGYDRTGCRYNIGVRLRLITLILLIAALGCSVPPALTPTPTFLPVTPASLRLTQTADTKTPEAQPTAYTPRATGLPAPVNHRIAIRQLYGLGEFYDRQNGQTFTPRGVNYMPPNDVTRVRADFQWLGQAGYNTVRIIFDDCPPAWGCLTQQGEQGLNPAALDAMVVVMNLAQENDLVLLLALGDLPEEGGYSEMVSQGSSEQFVGYRNTSILTSQGLQAYQHYWSDLLSGLSARNAPFELVLGWQLLAEQWYQGDQPPFSLLEGTVTGTNGSIYDLADPQQKQALAVDGLNHFISELRQVIRRYDPTALIGMGFAGPQYPNPTGTEDSHYVETAALLSSSELDFFDLHLDPDTELTLAEYAQNIGLDTRIDVPLLMGEVSVFTWTYPLVESAATAVQDWIAASCAYGFDGWLYGSYRGEPGTWNLSDDDGYLMQAISPRSQPDACSTTVLPGRNLALGRAVSVSAGLPTEPPEMVVDGTDAQWSAGAFAEQWLMVDLGAPYMVGSIRLLVGQWPAGRTLHQLFVAGADGAMRLLTEFRGYTRDYDLLEYVPPEPLRDIQYIRVVTLESPAWVAWREIEILSPFRPTPTPTAEPASTVTP
jgi:hypothetical protein